MHSKQIKIIGLFIFLLSIINVSAAEGNPKPLYKKGSYYEFFYRFEALFNDTLWFSARVESDTVMDGIKYQVLKVYNEPFMGNYCQYYYHDTITNILYSRGGYTNGCLDSSLKQTVLGFNWPKGTIFNTCSDTMGGAYFRSFIIDTGTFVNIFNSGIPLRASQRKDTVGNPIFGTRQTVFSEMFGFLTFYQGYGSPYGGGWYHIQLNGAIIDSIRYGRFVLGISQISANIPENLSLSQNYPNPFNPTTTIEFSLPKRTNVKLRILDILGKEVSLLFEEKKSAGSYRYKFNSGYLPSGVYFYRLETDYGILSRKMIVIK